jgi:Glycosyltransferase Family 4
MASQRVCVSRSAQRHVADHVVAVSHHLRDEIIRMYEVPHWKVSTVYNGVNVRNYDGGIEPAEVKARIQHRADGSGCAVFGKDGLSKRSGLVG